MSLYAKMHAVMCESEAVEKNLVVGEGKNSYKAVSEAAILNGVKPLLKKHGLVLFPIGVSIVEDFKETEGKYGASYRYLSTLHAKYKIVDIETGESEILETVGYGTDSQDKGSGKAMTYAYKALLQKTFMLFSGEDTDNEHSDEITKKNTVEREKIDKNKSEVLKEKAGDRLNGLLAFYKVGKVEDMNNVQWVDAMKKLEVSK